MTTLKILIPLDGSEFSRQIVPYVARFFDPANCELILLHVAPVPPQEPAPESVRPPVVNAWSWPAWDAAQGVRRAAHPVAGAPEWPGRLPVLADELQEDARLLQEAGHTVSMVVRFGDPVREILGAVEDEGADLVAMATHGRTGLRRLVLGSVAEEVLRGAGVPVMLVRPFEEPLRRPVPAEVLAQRLAEGKAVRMVVATDGSPHAEIATAFAGRLARALRAEVTLLVAVHDETASPQQPRLERARSLLGDVDSLRTVVPLTWFNYSALLAQLAGLPTDLLVIGPFEDHNPARPFSIGLTARRLAQLAPTPVLVVKGETPAVGRILACTTVGDETVVDVATRLAQAVGAELQLLHVVGLTAEEYLADSEGVDIPLSAVLERDTPEARYLKACLARLDELGFDHQALKVRCGALPEAIFEEALAGDFDLIVVGSRTRPEYFLGSLADRVVRYAPRSVLVVRTV